MLEGGTKNLVLTFEDMLKRTAFADRMRRILQILEENYHSPVDMEFTVEITEPEFSQTSKFASPFCSAARKAS